MVPMCIGVTCRIWRLGLLVALLSIMELLLLSAMTVRLKLNLCSLLSVRY